MTRFPKFPFAWPLAAASLLAVVLWFSGPHASMAAAPPAPDVQDVYLDKCAVCHGKDGSGNTTKGRKLKVKDLRSPDAQKLSEAEMIDIVTKGKGKDMDGFEKELGKDTVKSLVTYYRALAKK
ncbi:MAG: cytochrome c [Candidatus Acidoferrales bacterium]|nr:cytochrome c [Candidatus Acidoferrales bacterium]